MNYMVQADKVNIQFMRLALIQANKALILNEVPIGAVVVKDNLVIAEGFNQPRYTYDPSAHAEIIALRAASRVLQNYRLLNCHLYVTIEPCPMCAGAILNARLKRVVYGACDLKSGACGSAINLFQKTLNHHTTVVSNVLSYECLALLKSFFLERRHISINNKNLNFKK